MLRVRSRVIGGWLLAGGLLATTVVGACADQKGAIMLAVTTDMKAPKDLNAVAVSISTNNKVKTSFIGRVTPQGDILLPGTVAIAEPDEKNATVRIRVMAFQNQKPRVIRDVRTTVPTGGRIALLRIPLNFVNDGKVVGDLLAKDLIPPPVPGSEALGPPETPDNTGTSADTSGDLDFALFGYAPKDCKNIDLETIIDGECKDSFIDSSTLPEFDSAQLGDSTGQSGACFSVGQCFSTATGLGQTSGTPVADGGVGATDDGGTSAPDGSAGGGVDAGPKPFKDFRPAAVTFDRGTCSLLLNGADPARLNIAIVTPETGECVHPGECYIPIDHGATGWQEDASGRVQLPSYLCKLLDTKGLRLATSSDTCAAKTESNPICTPKIGDDAGISPAVDGGADATVPGTAFSVPEDFAAAVSISGTTLYFASQSRQGFVALADPAAKPAPISGIAVAGSAHLPWRFGPAPGGAALTNGTTTGYVLGLQGGSQAITFPLPVIDVASIDAGFVWATTQPTSNVSFFVAPPLPFQAAEVRVADVTAMASLGGAYVLAGDTTGSLHVCQPQFMSCGQPAPAGSARIDGFAFRDGSTNGYALTASGLYSVSVNTSIGAAAVQPIFSDPPSFAGIQEGPLYFAHGVATGGSCVVFSTLNGLFYITDQGGKLGPPTPLVPAVPGQPILGVAVGPDRTSAGKAAYYTVFAPRDAAGGSSGGGVYQVKLPAECTSTSSGADAGAPDSGVVCGPGNCPTGCCKGNACVPGVMDAACGKNGVQCIDCTMFASTCGAVSQMCN